MSIANISSKHRDLFIKELGGFVDVKDKPKVELSFSRYTDLSRLSKPILGTRASYRNQFNGCSVVRSYEYMYQVPIIVTNKHTIDLVKDQAFPKYDEISLTLKDYSNFVFLGVAYFEKEEDYLYYMHSDLGYEEQCNLGFYGVQFTRYFDLFDLEEGNLNRLPYGIRYKAMYDLTKHCVGSYVTNNNPVYTDAKLRGAVKAYSYYDDSARVYTLLDYGKVKLIPVRALIESKPDHKSNTKYGGSAIGQLIPNLYSLIPTS
jgi:hypothetical protein